MVKQEARKDVLGLSNLIDYFAAMADGVVLTSTGVYVSGFEFEGHDMDALTPSESWQIAHTLAKNSSSEPVGLYNAIRSGASITSIARKRTGLIPFPISSSVNGPIAFSSKKKHLLA